eukprot:211313_1
MLVILVLFISVFTAHGWTKTCSSKDSCGSGVTCPSNQPCLVKCSGESSCKDTTIDGSDATSVTIRCTNKDSCQDTEMICGSGGCYVYCSGESSCKGNASLERGSATYLQLKCINKDACVDLDVDGTVNSCQENNGGVCP